MSVFAHHEAAGPARSPHAAVQAGKVPHRDTSARRRADAVVRFRPAIGVVTLAFASMLAATGAHAGPKVAAFDVNIHLTSATSSACGTANVGGGSLAIVCGNTNSGGALKVGANDVTPTAGYRALTRRDDTLASADAYGGAITTTAVRVLNVAGRQFIEMTVGW